MTPVTDYAFEDPVRLKLGSETLIRTAAQAANIVSSSMRARFTIYGLNTLLMLERALLGDEVEQARLAFSSWATQEGLA
jgi:hypothetical protein